MEPPAYIFITNALFISQKSKIWKSRVNNIKRISSNMQHVYSSLDNLYAETQHTWSWQSIRGQDLDNDGNNVLFQLDHKHWAVYGNVLLVQSQNHFERYGSSLKRW